MTHELPEKHESLWRLAAAPIIWAAHFLLSYVTAAIFCAKFAPRGVPLVRMQLAIGFYTLVALTGFSLLGLQGWQRHRFGDASLPHDFDSPADRHRFLGFATLLLTGLGAVAVIYEMIAALLLGSC